MGIFNDIEQSENLSQDTDLIVGALIRSVKDSLRGRMLDVPPHVAYRGKLDGRIPRPYPGPAKRGNFWIGEYEGQIGSSLIIPGDCLVRINGFDRDWILISAEEITVRMASRLSAEKIESSAVLKEGKSLNDIKNALAGARQMRALNSKAPTTKAAPGTHKRKIILED